MRTQAAQVLKDKNDFSADDTRKPEFTGKAGILRLAVLNGGVEKLLQKEDVCCSMATD